MNLREQIGHDLLLCPGVAVIVENPEQQILLQKRSDTGEWDVPGGGVEIGDTFSKSAVKELEEETGLLAEEKELTPIACLSRSETQLMNYPNGDQTQYYSMLFLINNWSFYSSISVWTQNILFFPQA